MKVYILCPAYVATGGIELIHQFRYKMELLGFDAYIYYCGLEEGRNPIYSQYVKYDVKMTDTIEDATDNIVVFPEIYTSLLQNIHNAKKCYWWMSVDNASGTAEDFKYLWNSKNIYHLVQSQYALEYVKNNGIGPDRIYWLGDYINSEYLHLEKVDEFERDPMVLFNPRKGYKKTSEIIEKSVGDIRWQPLTGFIPKTMRERLLHSKIYIDFGNHPGRDRIPREASMCGCLVITNKKGAAANSVDIPIDDKYKFDDDSDPIEIVAAITELIKDYDKVSKDYEEYVKRTAHEFQSFEVDIFKAFDMISGQKNIIDDAVSLKASMLEAIYNGDIQEAFRNMVKYRVAEYDEDQEYLIIELNIRLELGEIYEAEYLAKELLEVEPDNYETLLLLAKAHSLMDTKSDLLKCIEECQMAVELSKGTADESEVTREAINYASVIKERIAGFN